MSTETAVVADAVETEQVSMLEFIEAYEVSVEDGSGYEGLVKKLDGRITIDTAKARASKLRNPEYELTDKLENGKNVYRRAVDGPNGETETTDKELAKKNTQGKSVKIRIFKLDAAGNKIEKRPGLELSDMPAVGGKVRVANQVEDARALLARLKGERAARAAATAGTAS